MVYTDISSYTSRCTLSYSAIVQLSGSDVNIKTHYSPKMDYVLLMHECVKLKDLDYNIKKV